LYAPKKEVNIGGAIRAAGVYNANFVMLEGVRYERMKTDTQHASRHMPLFEVPRMVDALPIDCARIAVEIVDGATPLPRFVHPERALYIFGPEDGSIPKDILDRCKYKVFVPTSDCMNLAATVNVVLYDRMAKASR
jgi:tRNA(Leu) C34 or U34 (ribose-2'-O)-methylase TrmL